MLMFRLFPLITILSFATVPFISAAIACDLSRYPDGCNVAASRVASLAVQSERSPPRLHRQRAKARHYYRVPKRNLVIPNRIERNPVRTINNPVEPLKLPPPHPRGPKFNYASADILAASFDPITPRAVTTMSFAPEPRRVWPADIVTPREPVEFVQLELSAVTRNTIAIAFLFAFAALIIIFVQGIDPRKINPEATNDRRPIKSHARRAVARWRRACIEAVAGFAGRVATRICESHPERQRDWLYIT